MPQLTVYLGSNKTLAFSAPWGEIFRKPSKIKIQLDFQHSCPNCIYFTHPVTMPEKLHVDLKHSYVQQKI